MDTCRKFNPYSCGEHISGFERKGLDRGEIRRDCSGERTKES